MSFSSPLHGEGAVGLQNLLAARNQAAQFELFELLIYDERMYQFERREHPGWVNTSRLRDFASAKATKAMVVSWAQETTRERYAEMWAELADLLEVEP